MPDYQLGKIYKIVNNANDYIYVGSTAQKLLSVRWGHHKRNALDMTRQTPIYKAVREIGIEHFRIILIKMFPCASKLELEAEEYKTMQAMKQQGVLLYNVREDSKGFTLSEETKQKIRASSIGKTHAEESKQKIREKNTGKKRNDETKQKISESNRGAKHPIFNFGSITFKRTTQSWAFQWYEHNKSYSKSFSTKKYGFFEALRLAENERKTIYPQWQTAEEEALEELSSIDI